MFYFTDSEQVFRPLVVNSWKIEVKMGLSEQIRNFLVDIQIKLKMVWLRLYINQDLQKSRSVQNLIKCFPLSNFKLELWTVFSYLAYNLHPIWLIKVYIRKCQYNDMTSKQLFECKESFSESFRLCSHSQAIIFMNLESLCEHMRIIYHENLLLYFFIFDDCTLRSAVS